MCQCTRTTGVNTFIIAIIPIVRKSEVRQRLRGGKLRGVIKLGRSRKKESGTSNWMMIAN